MNSSRESSGTADVAIIGGGNMGAAFAAAVVERGQPEFRLATIVERNTRDRQALSEQYGITALAECDEQLRKSTILVLAVKPQDSSELQRKLTPFLEPHHTLVSVMAGVPIAQLREGAPQGIAVVRSMPNLPAKIGRGITVACSDSHGDPARGIRLLELLGKVLVVRNEALVDAATAISGTGPGYLYYFLEQLKSEAIEFGFSAAEAEQLVSETVAGSHALWQASGEDLAGLRARVTSPGGTTQAALDVFKSGELAETFRKGIRAAFARSVALARSR